MLILFGIFFCVKNEQIEDVAGSDEITLLRKFGNEQYVACVKVCLF
jgi:hypothetical protein